MRRRKRLPLLGRSFAHIPFGFALASTEHLDLLRKVHSKLYKVLLLPFLPDRLTDFRVRVDVMLTNRVADVTTS